MVSKSGSRGHASKISSAASPAVSGATQSSNKSSILRSAFSPSEYQLALFASVIHGLDAQHLRIHDTNTGRLQSEHAVNPKETITSLDWGYHGDGHRARDQHSKKKRKRSSGVNGAAGTGDVVVAFGTSASDIRMYSPSEDKIFSTLSGGHERGVIDFKFTSKKPGSEGWSIGGDGKLVQWDLHSCRSIRVISLPTTSITALARPVPSEPPVLCASQTPYIIHVDKEGSSGSISFDAMRDSVHTLIPSSSDLSTLSGQFLAADSDRYINIFDSEKRKLLGSLVADKEVDSVSLYSTNESQDDEKSSSEQQMLAVVTQDGSIEIFDKPFHKWNEPPSSNAVTSLKAQRKKMTRRADASVRIVRPDKAATSVPVVTASVQRSDIVVAMAEGGVNLMFDRIRWKDAESDELILRGNKEIVKAKSASSAVMNGVKDLGKSHVDESKAVVEQGGQTEDIIMSEDEENGVSGSDEEDYSGDEGEKAKKLATKKAVNHQSKEADEDIEMEDAEDETGEPSFGELLRANETEPIDVEAELEDTENRSLVTSKPNTSLQIPSGVSLATVLTQSLRTNDNNLLESCFHTTDTNIVRTTIQRMDSSLAGILLQKLAERLSSRPGRYGHLLVWVQWTCVAHGGAIAGKADILRKISSLFKVMDQRSSSLSSLLLLKGKLDMLDAQLGLRQALQSHPAGADSEDEDNVIYVEGQDDEEDSADEDVMMNEDAATKPATLKSKRDARKQLDLTADSEDDEDLPLAMNGVNSGSDDEDVEDEQEDLVDKEAEESEDGDSSQESGDEEESDELDNEEDEDEGSMDDFIQDSDEDGVEDGGSDSDMMNAPQPPPSKKARLHRGKVRGSKN